MTERTYSGVNPAEYSKGAQNDFIDESAQEDFIDAKPSDDPMTQDAMEQMEESEDEQNDSDLLDGDLPQAVTESLGTGVHDMPGYAIGGRTMRDRDRQFHEAAAELTGGDIDANYEQANSVGDESVGGTVATPDMDIVDDLGQAVGIEIDDRSFLRTNDLLEQRDDQRWELDPKSSEDYQERRESTEE
jgi:hypothetical protein